jgi:hypothetical protein
MSLVRPGETRPGPAGIDEIKGVRETAEGWLRKLDDQQAAKKIVSIEEDVLGAYFFRIPEIRIYWIVIGITARVLGVAIDALTIVVLAHELAHAYTHLGRDIDNEQWATAAFSASDLDIVEVSPNFTPMLFAGDSWRAHQQHCTLITSS